MKKNFGLETTELIFSVLKKEFHSLVARSLVSKKSFLDLKTRNPSQLLFPWTILKYERVSSDSPDNELIVTSTCTHPLEFRKQLEYLKSNCKVISLSELVTSIRIGKEISPETVVITFDGGFRNNFEVAFPILKEINLPATFFIPTGFIGTNQLIWQDQVAAAISVLVDSGRDFPVLNSIEREIAIELKESFTKSKSKVLLARGVVAAIEFVAPQDRVNCIEEISFLIEGIKFEEPERFFMNWDEARECHAAGFEIGSLGRFGISLLELNKQELAEELHLSYETLFNNKIEPSRVFALPKGSVTEESEKFLFEMGFPYVVGEGFFSPFSSNDKAQIFKRILVNNLNSKPLARFICRVSQVKKLFSRENY